MSSKERVRVNLVWYTLSRQVIRGDAADFFTQQGWDLDLAQKSGLDENELAEGTNVMKTFLDVSLETTQLTLDFDKREEQMLVWLKSSAGRYRRYPLHNSIGLGCMFADDQDERFVRGKKDKQGRAIVLNLSSAAARSLASQAESSQSKQSSDETAAETIPDSTQT